MTIVTDLTVGMGRFNFAHGVIGTLTGIAASLSTTATGFLVEEFGHAQAKPQQYLD